MKAFTNKLVIGSLGLIIIAIMGFRMVALPFEKPHELPKEEVRTEPIELKPRTDYQAKFDELVHIQDEQTLKNRLDQLNRQAPERTVDDWLDLMRKDTFKNSPEPQRKLLTEKFIADLAKSTNPPDFQKFLDHFDDIYENIDPAKRQELFKSFITQANNGRTKKHATDTYNINVTWDKDLDLFYAQTALITKLVQKNPTLLQNLDTNTLRQLLKSFNIAFKKENLDQLVRKNNNGMTVMKALAATLSDFTDTVITASKGKNNAELQLEVQKLLTTLFEQFNINTTSFNFKEPKPSYASSLMSASALALDKLFDNPALQVSKDNKNLKTAVAALIEKTTTSKKMLNNPGFEFLAFRYDLATDPQAIPDLLKKMSPAARIFALDRFAKKIDSSSGTEKTELIKELNSFVTTVISEKTLLTGSYNPTEQTGHLALLALLDNHLGKTIPELRRIIRTALFDAVNVFLEKTQENSTITEDQFIPGALNILRIIDYLQRSGQIELSAAVKQTYNVLDLAFNTKKFITTLAARPELKEVLDNLLKAAHNDAKQTKNINALITNAAKQALSPFLKKINAGDDITQNLATIDNPTVISSLFESLITTLRATSTSDTQKATTLKSMNALLEKALSMSFDNHEQMNDFAKTFIMFFDTASNDISSKMVQDLLATSFKKSLTKDIIATLKIPDLRLKLLTKITDLNQINKDQLIETLTGVWPEARENETERNVFLDLIDKVNLKKLSAEQIEKLAPVFIATASFRSVNNAIERLNALKNATPDALLPEIYTTISDFLNTYAPTLKKSIDILQLLKLRTSADSNLNNTLYRIIPESWQQLRNDPTDINELNRIIKNLASNKANQQSLIAFISGMFKTKPDFADITDVNTRKKRTFLETLKTTDTTWNKLVETLKPTSLSIMWVETRLKDPEQIQKQKPEDFQTLLSSMNDLLKSGTEKNTLALIFDKKTMPAIIERFMSLKPQERSAELATQFVDYLKKAAEQSQNILVSAGEKLPTLLNNIGETLPIQATDISKTIFPKMSAPDQLKLLNQLTFISPEVKTTQQLELISTLHDPTQITQATIDSLVAAKQTDKFLSALSAETLKTVAPTSSIGQLIAAADNPTLLLAIKSKTPLMKTAITDRLVKLAQDPTRAENALTEILKDPDIQSTDLIKVALNKTLSDAQFKVINDRLISEIQKIADRALLNELATKYPSLKPRITSRLLDIAADKATAAVNVLSIVQEAFKGELTAEQINTVITALARSDVQIQPNALDTIISASSKLQTKQQNEDFVKNVLLPLYDHIDRTNFDTIEKLYGLAEQYPNLTTKHMDLITEFITNTKDLKTGQILSFIMTASRFKKEPVIISALANVALKWDFKTLTSLITDKQTRTDVVNQILDQAANIEVLKDVAGTLDRLNDLLSNKELTFDVTRFTKVLTRTLSDQRALETVLRIANKITDQQAETFIKQIINPLYDAASKNLDYQTIERLSLLAVKPQFKNQLSEKQIQLMTDFIGRNASALTPDQIEDFITTAVLLGQENTIITALANLALQQPNITALINKMPIETQTKIMNAMLDNAKPDNAFAIIELALTLAIPDITQIIKVLTKDNIKTLLPNALDTVVKIAAKIPPEHIKAFADNVITPLYEKVGKDLNFDTIQQLGKLLDTQFKDQLADKHIDLINKFMTTNAAILKPDQLTAFIKAAQALGKEDDFRNTLADIAIQQRWAAGNLQAILAKVNVTILAKVIDAIKTKGKLEILGDKLSVLQGIEKLVNDDAIKDTNLAKQLTDVQFELLKLYTVDDFKTMPEATAKGIQAIIAIIQKRINTTDPAQFATTTNILEKIHDATSTRLDELSSLFAAIWKLFGSYNYEKILNKDTVKKPLQLTNKIAQDLDTWQKNYKQSLLNPVIQSVNETQKRLNKIAQPT